MTADDEAAEAPEPAETPTAAPGVDPRLRWLLWAAVALIGFGIWAFVLRGADGPADPSFGGPAKVIDAPGDPGRVPLDPFTEIAIRVSPGDGRDDLGWCLLAALNKVQRAQGLMGVTDLQGYSGMAFIYAEDVQNSFHMQDTPTPLSIGWIDAAGGLVAAADMAPCGHTGCPLYPPGAAYRYAIEVPQGELDDLGIIPGSVTTFGGPCSSRTG